MAAIDITGGGGGGGASAYLRITGAPNIIDATLRQVEDQAGDLSILWLSLTEAQFTGTFISNTDSTWWKGFDGAGNARLEMYHNAQGIWEDNLSKPAIIPSTPLTESFIFRTYDATNTALQKALVIKKGCEISLRKDDYYTTQNVCVINTQSPASGWGVVIQPGNGGAFMLNAPDGAATGGNARGQYAVDLQMQRTAADQVASALNSGILSGRYNKVAGDRSVIAGGVQNTIGSTQNSGIAAIAGGYLNVVTDQYGSFIGAGENNVISGSGWTNAIGSGGSNTINAGYGSFIGSGSSNTISNNYSGIISGQSNSASALYSAVLGGQSNTAGAQYSTVKGYFGNSYLYGQHVISNGRFSVNGDAQGSEVILRIDNGFTDLQTKELFLDGSSLRIAAFSNSAMTVNVDIVAIVTAITGTAIGVSVGDTFSQNSLCSFKNIGGVGNVVQSGSIIKKHDLSMAACDTTYTPTGGSLQILFTGPNFAGGGSVTLRVVAKARLVETRF